MAVKKIITNDDLVDITSRANELSMELILVHNKIQRGHCEQIVHPAAILRVMSILAMWSANFTTVMLDRIEQQMRDEAKKKAEDEQKQVNGKPHS